MLSDRAVAAGRLASPRVPSGENHDDRYGFGDLVGAGLFIVVNG